VRRSRIAAAPRARTAAAWAAATARAAASILGGAAAAAAGEAGAQPPAPYYGRADFRRIEKVDAHMHVHGRADRLVAQAIHDHVHILTINVDYGDFPPVPEQLRAAASLRRRYPGRVAFAGTFTVADFNTPAWPASALAQIDEARAQGAVGIKIWKNIGMTLRDASGRYVMPDDPRLEPIYQKLEREHVVLLGHQAEPVDCWLPFAKMTVRSDRDYYRAHPQYYMYRHPDLPSHDRILAARDRMLAAHPDLRFDALHLASLEWNVDAVAAFLDRFPNARVDIAARIAHLEYQASKDPARVRRFLIRYQDRILYGTDDEYGPADDDPRAVAAIAADWRHDWRFLVTDDTLHSPEFAAPFRGMHLPRGVVDKIYRENALRLFPAAWPGLN
jgi:predicted TIM-barrel fold metal-dependent hydrolase